jgi:CRP/FNR family cyclic AMP-dependent transcriptional regulator
MTRASSTDSVPGEGVVSIEELARLPALAPLSLSELQSIAGQFSLRAYPKDAIVATEGEPLAFFHFILSGHVQAFWRDDEGHQLKLGIDEPGMHFPDQAMYGEPTLVSHVAVTDLRLAAIRREDLMALLERHPQVAAAMLKDVVARLRRMIARARMLTMDDVYGRVVKLLLASAPDGRQVRERFTHAEIGHRVGATREMVGRVLRDLVRGGYIGADDGHIAILKKLPSRW